jgi:hypothetical protein
MLRQCRDYAKGDSHRLVFIGDYIDRGPDSRSLIENAAPARRAQRRPLDGFKSLHNRQEHRKPVVSLAY